MNIPQKLAIGYIRTKIKVLSMISSRRAAEMAYKVFCTPITRQNTSISHAQSTPLSFTMFHSTEKKKGINIRGYRWNHPQEKRILLLHGFGSAALKFQPYARMMAGKGYEIIAFDAPAHGSSDGKMINAVTYSEMIKSVISKYGPFNGFIAHSFGCLALSLALEQLEPVAETRIVFIAPATETTSAVDNAFAMLRLHDKEVRQEFEKIIIRMTGKEIAWFSIRRAIRNISARVLWIHDEEDIITPVRDALHVQSDEHPNIEFMITKGLGHRKIYHDPVVKKAVSNHF